MAPKGLGTEFRPLNSVQKRSAWHSTLFFTPPVRTQYSRPGPSRVDVNACLPTGVVEVDYFGVDVRFHEVLVMPNTLSGGIHCVKLAFMFSNAILVDLSRFFLHAFL